MNTRRCNIYQILWILRSLVSYAVQMLKFLIAVNACPMLAENQYMSYIENELADDGFQNCTWKDLLHIANIFITRHVYRWF
jgi:hypothetical protein